MDVDLSYNNITSAPEIYKCSCEEYGVLGYGFAVDWWSLGVLGWETLAGTRPFPVHASTSHREALAMLCGARPLETPARWTRGGVREVIESLLAVEPLERCSSLKELKQLGPMSRLDFDAVLNKRLKPAFTPPKDHLNCDPTFELEEMIVETKPLHKKKKRLAKQRSLKAESLAERDEPPQAVGQLLQHQASDQSLGLSPSDQQQRSLAFIPEYRIYNRERELERLERERKERQWEEELNTAMGRAEQTLQQHRYHHPHHHHHHHQQGLRSIAEQEPSSQQQLGSSIAKASTLSGACSRLSVSTASVRARISGSPHVTRRGSVAGADLDFIDASPEPSTS